MDPLRESEVRLRREPIGRVVRAGVLTGGGARGSGGSQRGRGWAFSV